jgi:hypothetical protein
MTLRLLKIQRRMRGKEAYIGSYMRAKIKGVAWFKTGVRDRRDS